MHIKIIFFTRQSSSWPDLVSPYSKLWFLYIIAWPSHLTTTSDHHIWPSHLTITPAYQQTSCKSWPRHYSALLVESGNPTDLGKVEVFDKQILNIQPINNYPIFIENSYNNHDQKIVLGIFEKFLVWLGRFSIQFSI